MFLVMYKYILVVDDDISLAHAMQSYLSSQERKVFIVDNVLAAIKLLRLYSFDLVISDVMMSNYSGYDLLYYLRLSQDLALMPLIFLTAKGMTLDRIQGYDLGCSAYLIKPFYPSELLSVVNNLLYSFSESDFFYPSCNTDREPHDVNFTGRELSVLRSLVKGMTNREIAVDLNVSVRNVEKYVGRLLNKTATRNRTELAQFFTFSQAIQGE